MKKLSEQTIFNIIKTEAVKKDEKFVTGKCYKCQYPVGYIWINDHLYFDVGCFCTDEKKRPKLQKRESEELLKFIRKNLIHLQEYFEKESTYIN